jgi:hypothetical protein
MPRGPAIDEGDILIESLVKEGRITVLKKMDGPYPEYMFTIVGEADAIDDGEMQSVREAVAWIGNRTAKELSDITHRASWDETDNGEEMNIYADLIDPEEYDAIKQRQQAIKRELDGIQSAEQC